MERLQSYVYLYDRAEMRATAWMEEHGDTLLRVAMAVVFIWFGILEPFGLSPAEELVADTTTWIPIPRTALLAILGTYEVFIGIFFLFRRTIRIALIMLFLHMPGTMLPLVALREETFETFPHALTVEGQYIIKNVVLIAAAIVIGGKIRHRMSGALTAAPEAFHQLLRRGRWGSAQPGDFLTEQGQPVDEVFFIRSGSGTVRIDDRTVGQLRRDQFIGEMSFLADSVSTATVEVTTPVEYIAWTKDELRDLSDDEQDMEHAMQVSMNLDVVEKLRRANQNGELDSAATAEAL